MLRLKCFGIFLTILNFWIIILVSAQKDPHWVDNRATIVQLLEWKWADIAKECEDFLSKKFYAGVQISPPNENIIISSPNRPWWERYQPVSYKLVTRSGDENALSDMIKRCNKVGIRIYADTVINHMTAFEGKGTAGTTADLSKKSYPGVPYSSENFHSDCTINNTDANSVRSCQWNFCPDLDQSQDYVRQKIKDYMNHLIHLGVAGFHIQAAKYMNPQDLEQIFKDLDNLNTEHGFKEGSRAYIYQEVDDTGSDSDVINNTEYLTAGRVVEFKTGWYLGEAFQGRNLSYLTNWGDVSPSNPNGPLLDREETLQMIDNEETQRATLHGRILNYKKMKNYKAALAFMLAHPYRGHTRVISSYAFDDLNAGPPATENGDIISPEFKNGTCTNGWICEHRWPEIANMVEFRSVCYNPGAGYNQWVTQSKNQIAIGMKNRGFAMFNVDDKDFELRLNEISMEPGEYCDVISGSLVKGKCTGKTVVVNSDKSFKVTLEADNEHAALAFHAGSKL